jgi:hypothetical protein
MSTTNVPSTNTTATPPQVRETPWMAPYGSRGGEDGISTEVAKKIEEALF